MFRVSTKSAVNQMKTNSTSVLKKTSLRTQSTSSHHSGRRSGGTKLLLTLLGGSAVAAGGAAAYAKYDPKFQVTLEQNLPYAEEVFKFIPDWKTPPYSEQEKSVKEVKEKSLMTKKLERDSVKKEETASKPVVMKEPAADEKLEEIPVSKAQTQELSAKKRTDDKKAAQEKVLQEAEVTVSLNRALEERIVSRKESLERLARDAIAAQLLAVEAVKQHTQKLYKALDEPSDAEDKSMWVEINAASEARDKALNNASTTAADVKVSIEELKAAVADGQANKLTAQNPSLLPAEVAISRILYQIQTAETEVAKGLGESNVVSEYKDIIEKGKEQFKKELEAILPDVKLGQKVNEENLNILIAHAYRRVEHLQRQLAKQAVTEQNRVQKAMEKQREEDCKIADTQVSIELANQQRELEIAHQKGINDLKEELEHELRQQLRRQAAAHNDHLQEVLLAQQKEMSRKHELNVKDKLLQEKTRQLSELADAITKLKSIEVTVKAREQLDTAARNAQKLWLACQALKQSIKSDQGGHDQPKPLSSEIMAIMEAAEEDKPYVSAVLAGIPQEAVQRGVFTEESLKERFHKVSKVCRRVALVDENGGSLYQYLVSFLQSVLVIESAKIPVGELTGKTEVDPSQWHTFDILTRIRHCLEKEDLEQALRYANQLKGEPRNLARDWIKELRLLLETRQAADALIVHAAAVSVQAYH